MLKGNAMLIGPRAFVFKLIVTSGGEHAVNWKHASAHIRVGTVPA